MALDSIAGSAPATRDIGALEAEITELAAHLAAATHRLLTLIREFDQRAASPVTAAWCTGWKAPGAMCLTSAAAREVSPP